MSRIFFVAIARRVDASAFPMDVLYEAIGRNTGNLLFTNAVWQHIAWEEAGSGFEFDPQRVNERFDVVVIPAANWLYEHFDFSALADRISQLRIPVILIGIGAQARKGAEVPKLPSGTVRFLRAVSERSALIGTRGAFSSEVLEAYGIHNHVAIGCPSLFSRYPGARIRKRELRKVLVGGTRYGPPGRELSTHDALHRTLYAFAADEECDVNFQSERPELDVLVSVHNRDAHRPMLTEAIARYYGFDSTTLLQDFLLRHGRYFLDADDWISAMSDYDFYIGTRIHGVIASLIAGTPALLVSHDSRTAELGTLAAIPQIDIRDIQSVDGDQLNEVYSELNFDGFERRLADNFRRYLAFLEANGLLYRANSVPEAS